MLVLYGEQSLILQTGNINIFGDDREKTATNQIVVKS